MKKNKLRLAIDGGGYDLSLYPQNGIQRHLKELINQIKTDHNQSLEIDYYFFNHKKNSTALFFSIKLIRLPQRFFSQLFLPLAMWLRQDKIFLGYSGCLPVLCRFFRIKSIIFIHDFGFYKNPDKYKQPLQLQKQTKYAINHADCLVVFSDYIKEELIKRFPQAAAKVVRIYPGWDHLPLPKRRLLKSDYFLYVGLIKPTKNVHRIIALFDRYKQLTVNATKLVLIGSVEKNYWHQILLSQAYQHRKLDIIHYSQKDDQQLSNYYHFAKAFINLADDEGFCFPLGEALARQTIAVVNHLELYEEFKKLSPNLLICKNEEAVLTVLQHLPKPLIVKQPPLSWRHYWLRLKELIFKTQ
jgi:glycosyltransferase involved in cell wall biosynthesis